MNRKTQSHGSRSSGRVLLAALLGLAQLSACAGPTRHDGLVVFAAASLEDVMQELASAYAASGGPRPFFNFAGSNVLAQQLAAAPRGQVFVSADGEWIDTLAARGLLVPDSRRPVFGNRLVLVAHSDTPRVAEGDCPSSPLGAAGARLVIADPAGVPAGRYARAALEAIDHRQTTLWRHVAPTAIPTADVRAALALVEATPGLLGIVYRTDAASSSRVRVLCEVATPADRPIVYWAVALGGGDEAGARAANRFLSFLEGGAARRVVERHGFGGLQS